MKQMISLMIFCLALVISVCARDTTILTLTSPLDYQVTQRSEENRASILVSGTLTGNTSPIGSLNIRLSYNEDCGTWQPLKAEWEKDTFSAHVEVPAGGWYQLEVRVLGKDAKLISAAVVEHFGVGEVFVVAGQSNSANFGEIKQNTKSLRVASFDGKFWRLSNDPQPGANGSGGSFMPPFGDGIAEHFNVPVGIIACGQGGTSIREWLPEGASFPNPPTVERNVQKTGENKWESKGILYSNFIARLKQLGPNGFRAVLWHQGESDANQKDSTRTLPGKLYYEYMTKLITDSRRETGWSAPWFVAQVSYHSPDDEADPEIRAAQAALWKDGTALQGPDTDALKGEFRDHNGAGVHFSGPGLQALANSWLEKVVSWLNGQLP